MRIGIDIDGVLTDEYSFVLDYGTKYFSEKKIKYNLHNDIYDSENIFEVTEKQYNDFWEKYIFYYSENILIRPFASEVIKRLKSDGNDIYIITSRSFTTSENKYKAKMQNIVKEWLDKNNVVYDELIFSRNKSDICKEKNIDIMIEDKPENISLISKDRLVICYDHPYNNKLTNENIIRCYSWFDIYDKIIHFSDIKN